MLKARVLPQASQREKEGQVTGEEMLITCTITLSPDGALQKRARALPFVHDGGAGVTIGRTFKVAFNLAI